MVPYTECQLGQETQEIQETVLAPKKFLEKECIQGRKEIPHQKMLPECRNVTKQNCVTLWETDEQGNKQWAGTDSCEPVTWQECKLVPKEVTFIVPEITCEDKQECAQRILRELQYDFSVKSQLKGINKEMNFFVTDIDSWH